MTPLERALDYLERRRAGESSEAWSRATITRYRATLRDHGVDYSDVPIRSLDVPSRATDDALEAFAAFLVKRYGSVEAAWRGGPVLEG